MTRLDAALAETPGMPQALQHHWETAGVLRAGQPIAQLAGQDVPLPSISELLALHQQMRRTGLLPDAVSGGHVFKAQERLRALAGRRKPTADALRPAPRRRAKAAGPSGAAGEAATGLGRVLVAKLAAGATPEEAVASLPKGAVARGGTLPTLPDEGTLTASFDRIWSQQRMRRTAQAIRRAETTPGAEALARLNREVYQGIMARDRRDFLRVSHAFLTTPAGYQRLRGAVAGQFGAAAARHLDTLRGAEPDGAALVYLELRIMTDAAARDAGGDPVGGFHEANYIAGMVDREYHRAGPLVRLLWRDAASYQAIRTLPTLLQDPVRGAMRRLAEAFGGWGEE